MDRSDNTRGPYTQLWKSCATHLHRSLDGAVEEHLSLQDLLCPIQTQCQLLAKSKHIVIKPPVDISCHATNDTFHAFIFDFFVCLVGKNTLVSKQKLGCKLNPCRCDYLFDYRSHLTALSKHGAYERILNYDFFFIAKIIKQHWS